MAAFQTALQALVRRNVTLPVLLTYFLKKARVTKGYCGSPTAVVRRLQSEALSVLTPADWVEAWTCEQASSEVLAYYRIAKGKAALTSSLGLPWQDVLYIQRAPVSKEPLIHCELTLKGRGYLATVRYGKTTIQRKVSSLVRDAAVDMGKLIVSCVESLKQRKLFSLAFEACRDLEGVLWLSDVTEYSLTQELVTENRCIRVTEQTARTERKPKPVYTETPQFNPAHDETFLCVVSKMNGVSPEQTRREVSRLKRLSQPVPATPRARVRKRIYRSRNAVAHNVYARYQPSAFLNVLSSTRVSFPKWTEPTGATPSFKRGSASARMIGVRTCKQFRFV